MTNQPRQTGDQPRQSTPPAPQREWFCIHSYAGELGRPCGWRGFAVRQPDDDAVGILRCPRCGRATLLEIPLRAPEAP